jgi:hypothetical protein
MDTKIEELRRDIGTRASDTQTKVSGSIVSMLPQLGQKKVSAYEPEWRKLVRRTTETQAVEAEFSIENPLHKRKETDSLTNIVVTVETPTSMK